MVIIMDFKLVDIDAVIFTRLLTLRGNLKNQFNARFKVSAGGGSDCRCPDLPGLSDQLLPTPAFSSLCCRKCLSEMPI